MTVIDNPESLNMYRLLALKGALKMEVYGMRRRGASAFSIIKKETGLKARSAKELLPLYEDWLEVQEALMDRALAEQQLVASRG
jgi:hypothetical protein